MRSIMFSMRPGIEADKQDALLARLKTLPGIAHASSLSPQAKNPDVRRMCFAHVADDANVDEVLAQVRREPEVEQANLPAERRLIR
jgi:hypothetical protein